MKQARINQSFMFPPLLVSHLSMLSSPFVFEPLFAISVHIESIRTQRWFIDAF